jgi:hypothetical protein
MGTENEVGKVYVVYNDWIRDPVGGYMPYKLGSTIQEVLGGRYAYKVNMPGELRCALAYEFCENYIKIEKALQAILSKLNRNGEWFELDRKTIEGIRSICKLLGGKDVSGISDEEMEDAQADGTSSEMDPSFERVVSQWNETSDMKAVGKASGTKRIHIEEIGTVGRGLCYKLITPGSGNLEVALVCRTSEYPGIEDVIEEFDNLVINGSTFSYIEPGPKSWFGGLQATVPLTMAVGDIVEIIRLFIEATKEKLIDACKACNEDINPQFEEIVSQWNETSDMKAVGASKRSKMIPVVSKKVWYFFKADRDGNFIMLSVNCRRQPGLLAATKKLGGLNIKGLLFEFSEPFSGNCCLCSDYIPQTMDVDSVVEVMKLFIEATKDKVIEECNKE